MRKLWLLFFVCVGLVTQNFAQSLAIDDSSVVHGESAKTWPAGPFSKVITNYGCLATSIPLIGLKGKGQTALELSLVHRSITTGNDMLVYCAGKGWSHTGVQYIFAYGTDFSQNVGNRPTQAWTTGTSGYTRKPGTRDTLSATSNGYKVVDYASKNTYYYERPFAFYYYYLTKIEDPFGNQVSYSYNGTSNNLYRITDASGRFIQFSYYPNTNLISNIHLEASPTNIREWDLQYENDYGGGAVYLGSVIYPSPDASTARPSIDFDSYADGQIKFLRTFSNGSTLGKLWGFTYGKTYGSNIGVREIFQPSKTNPTVSDSTPTYLKYAQVGLGTGPNDEIYCEITDRLGYVHRHSYYNDLVGAGVNAQSTVDFPFPIKRVNDPTVTLFTDPRNNQTPVGWNFWETYSWYPVIACLNTYTDRQGHATSYTYYASGDLINRGLVYQKSTTNVESGVTVNYTDTFTYTTDGKVSQHTDPYGTVKTYSYDATTRALTQEALDPSGKNLTKNFHYSASGQVDQSWIGSDPHTYYSNFDAYGNAQTVDPPNANASTFTFDEYGNRLTATEPSPKGTTQQSYDWWHRPIRTTFPDGNYTENKYDLEGNVTDVRMEDGSHRTTHYNFLNEADIVTVPVDGITANNLVTTTDYDLLGRKTSVTAPDGLISIFTYNERGDLRMVNYSDGTNRQWGYDGNGNILWRQNGRQDLTYYAYDQLNRLTKIDYENSGTPDVTYTYRKDGLRATMTDGQGTSTWTYNNAKELTSFYDAATTKTLTFTYDPGNGRPTSLVAPGNTWSYYYDSFTRPLYTTQTISGGEIVRYSDYNDDGSLLRRKYPNNTKTEYGYDTRGRTTSIRHAVTPTDVQQELLNYQYSNGNVSSYSMAVNGGVNLSTTYTHDYANRLKSEVRTDTTGTNAYSVSYNYTKGDDRTSTVRNGTTSNYTYFANTNRLKTGEGFTVNSYDADGNPTSITTPSAGTWTMTYDEDSRMTQLVQPSRVSTFKYNGDGQRIERSTPTSTYRYLLNGGSVVMTTTNGPSYNPQCYFTPGVGYFPGGQMHYYQENALGSAIVVRDAAGNWESLTEYDAYGVEYDLNGTQKSDFRFAGAHGYIKDDETGMELLGARYYLPVLGRFLNQDPIGLEGGLNLYGYCENNPLIKIDPDGKQASAPSRDSVTANPGTMKELIDEGVLQGGKEAIKALRGQITKYLEKNGIKATAHAVTRIIQRVDDVRTVVDIVRGGGGYYDPITDTNIVYSSRARQAVVLDRQSGKIITVLSKGAKSPRWIPAGRAVIDALLKKL